MPCSRRSGHIGSKLDYPFFILNATSLGDFSLLFVQLFDAIIIAQAFLTPFTHYHIWQWATCVSSKKKYMFTIDSSPLSSRPSEPILTTFIIHSSPRATLSKNSKTYAVRFLVQEAISTTYSIACGVTLDKDRPWRSLTSAALPNRTSTTHNA